jgi:hypothetical protein
VVPQKYEIRNGKAVIEYIDWKNSKLYKEYIVKKVNPRANMESKENKDLLKEDEIDYVKLVLTRKLKMPKINQSSPEIVKICEPFI